METQDNDKQEFNITVYTENQIGLLNRIAIIFTRRKINIDSLNTSPSEIESIHRFNIVITESEEVVRKLCRQIEKQVEVLKYITIPMPMLFGRSWPLQSINRCNCREGKR
jgi:acetolactate synthase-1/3 small subunit